MLAWSKTGSVSARVKRLRQQGVLLMLCTICRGEVIKMYPDDTPYPSVLIFGRTDADRPLHTVCAYDGNGDRIVIVTVYQPDPQRWEDNRRRKHDMYDLPW